MSTLPYLPPVNKLLTLGECTLSRGSWPDYLHHGFGPEHIPDLIRMALDAELHDSVTESDEVWAPVHAWRTLGQLHAKEAIEPLLTLLRRIDETDDDWIGEELPEVYERIGPSAIPALTAYLQDSTHGLWARVAAVSSLRRIGQRDFQARATCIPIFTEQLSQSATQNPSLNGFLVSALIDLQAKETVPVIRRAYADKHVDESICGDWEDVEIEFGLREEREAPRRPLFPFFFGSGTDEEDWEDEPFLGDDAMMLPADISNRAAHQSKTKTKARAKRKQQKKSRRKNRQR